MLDRFKTCLCPLNRRDMHKVASKRKKRMCSSLDLLHAPFAAMEVSNEYKQVFNLIDANGDGKISSFDLTELLLCLGCEKLKATMEAEVMVREMDRDGDGLVDFDEFFHTMIQDDDKEEEDNLMGAFLIFDADRDGLVYAAELHTVLTRLGFDKCSTKECRRMDK